MSTARTVILTAVVMYGVVGGFLGAAMKSAMPAMNYAGAAYYAATWPAFISAGTFHTPDPFVPHWAFTFKDPQP